MEYENFKGFSVHVMEVEDFLKQMDDKETLEIVKVDGYTFLHRSKTNELYLLSEPEVKNGL